MDCHEALLLISPHLDGALSKEEETALAEHVAVCEDCTRELALQERLSGALRNFSREEIQAPPELCGLVMAKLRMKRRGTLSWLPVAWRKAAAAAAAMLLIAAGSYAGITARLIDIDSVQVVVNNPTTPKVNVEPDSGVPPNDSLSQQDGPVQPPSNTGKPVNPGEGNTTGGEPGNETGTSNNSSRNVDSGKAPAVSTTGTSSEGPRAFLSSGIKVTNTELRMAVDDLDGARARAVALAAGSGAETQVFPEQSGSKKIVLIRITTTSEQATGIISGLTRVGTLLDRNDGSTDYTSIYNETLVKYHDLQSRISSARDEGEQSQMEAQAASYKQQLDDWAALSGKRVIMMQLESR